MSCRQEHNAPYAVQRAAGRPSAARQPNHRGTGCRKGEGSGLATSGSRKGITIAATKLKIPLIISIAHRSPVRGSRGRPPRKIGRPATGAIRPEAPLCGAAELQSCRRSAGPLLRPRLLTARGLIDHSPAGAGRALFNDSASALPRSSFSRSSVRPHTESG